MFKKGNRVYSEAYKYLRERSTGAVMLKGPGVPEDYEEEEMSLPLVRDVRRGEIHFGRWFRLRVGSLEYGEVKRAIIQRRYSMDDQMAIQLNRERGEEYEREYERMQEWRDFAAAVAREAAQGVVEDGLRLVGGEPGASGGE